MYDQNHEYFQLNNQERSIMLNTRQVILDFVQKLVMRLIDKQTSEISLLNICSTILNLGSSQYTLFFNSYENIWGKKYFNNALHGKKHCGREELIQRVMAKYRTRSAHWHTILNVSDVQIIDHCNFFIFYLFIFLFQILILKYLLEIMYALVAPLCQDSLIWKNGLLRINFYF